MTTRDPEFPEAAPGVAEARRQFKTGDRVRHIKRGWRGTVTGVLLCEFGKMHEATEYLMGHPILTHHFANHALQAAMQAAILEQCPGMPTKIEGCTKDNYLSKLAEIEAEVGPTQRIGSLPAQCLSILQCRS